MIEIIIGVFFVLSVVLGIYYFFKNNKNILSIPKKSVPVLPDVNTIKPKTSKRRKVGTPRKKIK